MARKKVEDLTPADLFAAAGQEINRLKALLAESKEELDRHRLQEKEVVAELTDLIAEQQAEIERQRERANEAQGQLVVARMLRDLKRQLKEEDIGA